MSNAQIVVPGDEARSRRFKQYGESGRWVSDLMPHIGAISGRPALHPLDLDAARQPRPGGRLPAHRLPAVGPSVGRRLGQLRAGHRQRQPARRYVVMKSQYPVGRRGRHLGPPGRRASCRLTTRAWSSAPASRRCSMSTTPTAWTARAAASSSTSSTSMSRQASTRPRATPKCCPKIAQYEMAYRMQDSVPEVTDISDEPDYILDMYGPQVRQPGHLRPQLPADPPPDRARREVRQPDPGRLGPPQRHRPCVTRATAGRSTSPPRPWSPTSKQRGPAGRHPGHLQAASSAGPPTPRAASTETSGRDHHGGNFTMWMAGGGVKAGSSYGASDDFSYNVAKDPVVGARPTTPRCCT